MLIKSMAGDFEISIVKFETEGGHLVMVGQMGVWDARTYVTPRELLAVLGKLLNPVVLFYFLRLPYLLFAVKSSKPKTSEGDES